MHSDPRAARVPSTSYKNLAQGTHLCLGAPVLLTVNFIWNVNTVPLGLMNGARGTVIAVLYARRAH